MIRVLAQSLLTLTATLLITSALIFFIIQLPEGDYLTSYIAELQAMGEGVNEEKIAWLRETYALDQPFLVQYWRWLLAMLSGDFGMSFEYNKPVAEIIGDRLGLTLALNLLVVLFVWAVAFPIGVISAVRQYSIADYVLTLFSVLGLALPSFLLALILLWLFNRWFGLSIGGLMAPDYVGQPWSLAKIGSIAAHSIVPVIVIGLSGTAAMVRRLRANLLDELSRPYVAAARARGLPTWRVLTKYPVRVALNPFIADIGAILPQLVSGSAIVSVVMSLPTTGPILVQALRAQDMYLAGAFLMGLSVLTILGLWLSDLALAWLDPRIRLGAAAGAGR